MDQRKLVHTRRIEIRWGDMDAQGHVNNAAFVDYLEHQRETRTFHPEDPFVAQELVETLYHVLWELVHVFFEHRGLLSGGVHDAGASAFLYPFLGETASDVEAVVKERQRVWLVQIKRGGQSIRLQLAG